MSTPPIPSSINHYITTILPKMDGWCSPEKATRIATTILGQNARLCLEIGVYAGRSLLAIALALRELGDGLVIGIDPWDPEASVAGWENDPANRDWWSGKTSNLNHGAIHLQCVAHIKRLQLDPYITLLPITSDAAAAMFKSAHVTSPWLNFLHIDGNHSEAQALRDVETFVPWVHDDGTVAFDDLDWSSTKQAQERLNDLCETLTPTGTCGFYRRFSTLTSSPS